jgi:PAS domain S-box-containing protein
MNEFLQSLLPAGSMAPSPANGGDLVWLHTVADLLLALAYLVIPLAVLRFLRWRRLQLPFWWVPALIALCLLLSGAVHLASAWTAWQPHHLLEGWLKAVAALASAVTAIAVWWAVPKALLLKTPVELQDEVQSRTRDLQASNRQLSGTIERLSEVQSELEASRLQLRQVIDALPVLVSYIDHEHRYMLVNRRYQEWFNRTEEELVGHSVREIVGEAAYADIEPTLNRVLAGDTVDHELCIDYLEAGPREVHVTSLPHRDASGITGCINLVEDISERAATTRALIASEARLRAAQAAARIGIYEYRPATGEVIIDEELQSLWKAMPDSRQFSRLLGLIHPEDQSYLQALFDQALGGDPEVFFGEVRVAENEGDERWLAVTGQAAIEDGCPTRVIGTVQDVTERKRTMAALREADRRKDEFLATLAHELRNPLAPIRNAIQLLKLRGFDAATVTSARDLIDRQLTQMTRLIDDLLDVSRISRGRIDIRREPVELQLALGLALDGARPLIDLNDHRLAVKLADETLQVSGDLVRLSQIFTNLLNNAAKYTPAGGDIELILERQGQEAEVIVRDNGIGIPAGMAAAIFDMFVQVDTSFERSHGGLGIGLTLAQQLTLLHGGRIEARSAGVGHGSEFCVRPPLLPAEMASATASHEETGPAHPGDRKVLIVDDNVDAAISLSLLLQTLGFSTRVAHDGREALATAPEFKPEVVVLDIGMPGLSGYDVARELRSRPGGSALRLVALTGWGHEEDKRMAREAGFDHHLTKPVSIDELLARLEIPS